MDHVYMSARLTAHLEAVEVRFQSFHRKAESLSDELSSQARRLADTTIRHSVRLEAVESHVSESHKQLGALGDELTLHARKLADCTAQQAASLGGLDERLGALQRRAEALGSELASHARKTTDSVASSSSRLGALEERSGQTQRQARQLSEQLGALSASLEEARRDLGMLAARVGAAEAATREAPLWAPATDVAVLPAPPVAAQAPSLVKEEGQPPEIPREDSDSLRHKTLLLVKAAAARAPRPPRRGSRSRPSSAVRAAEAEATDAVDVRQRACEALETSASQRSASTDVQIAVRHSANSSAGAAGPALSSPHLLRPVSQASHADSEVSLAPGAVVGSIVDGRIRDLEEECSDDGSAPAISVPASPVP